MLSLAEPVQPVPEPVLVAQTEVPGASGSDACHKIHSCPAMLSGYNSYKRSELNVAAPVPASVVEPESGHWLNSRELEQEQPTSDVFRKSARMWF